MTINVDFYFTLFAKRLLLRSPFTLEVMVEKTEKGVHMRKIFLAMLVLAFTAGGLILAHTPRAMSQEADEQTAHLPVVGVTTVKSEPVTITQELNGRVVPYLIAEVRPQVNGIILRRLFEEGSDVQQDMPLYQIDPAMYEAQLAQAEAELAKAYANADVAEAKLSRYEKLVGARAVNEQEYDEVEAAAKQAHAQVGIAEAMVRVARINVDYAKVLSPISGRIGKSRVTQGALVTASQAEPLTTVQQLDPIYVDVTQPVSVLLQLMDHKQNAAFLENTGESHAKMRVTLDNDYEYEHEGNVLFADVTVDQTTGSISLRAEFPNPDHTLLPGMYVQAQLDIAQLDHAITVPQKALFRESNGQPYVMVVNSANEVEKRPVQILRTIGEKWVLKSGLEEGTRVIVDGTQRVRFIPGTPAPKVNPVDADKAPATATQAG